MESKKANKAGVIDATEPQVMKKSSRNVLAVKKAAAKNEDKPRMYLKVRELLSNVKTELAAEVIADREK